MAALVFAANLIVGVAVVGATTIGTNISASGSITVGSTLTLTSTVNPQLGLGTTTPMSLLSINAIAGSSLFAIGSSTATILEVKETGITHGNDNGVAFADLIWEGDTDTALFVVDASADRVGIGTSTPAAYLSVDANGSGSAFVIGSSTAPILEVKSTGVVHGNDEGTSYIDFIWEGDTVTNLLVVDASGDRVGIATTTPSAMLSVGNSASDASATSTIDLGMPCFHMIDDSGGTKTDLYYWPSLTEGGSGGWATSTTSCF